MNRQFAPARRVPRELDLVSAGYTRLDPPLVVFHICVNCYTTIIPGGHSILGVVDQGCSIRLGIFQCWGMLRTSTLCFSMHLCYMDFHGDLDRLFIRNYLTKLRPLSPNFVQTSSKLRPNFVQTSSHFVTLRHTSSHFVTLRHLAGIIHGIFH